MATKKSNGEGTIYHQKDKNRWRGALTIGRNEEGKLIRKQFYGKTKKEVLDKMTDYKYKHNNNLLPSDDKITVGEYAHLWLFKFKYNQLKPASFSRYEDIVRLYIKNSQISNIKLKDLRAIDLQNYYNILSKKENITPNIIHNTNKILKAILSQAVKEGFILRNYCDLVNLPKLTKQTKINYLTREEQEKFLNACKGHRFETLFYLALYTGMRIGEILGLTWDNIDFENNIIHVKQSLRYADVVEEDGTKTTKILLQTPKTLSSVRDIPIPLKLTQLLKDYKKTYNKNKIAFTGTISSYNNFVFVTNNFTPLNQSNLRKDFISLLNKSMIPKIKFHGLRHTYATRLFEEGVPIKTVQVLMGHSNINTTMNIYTHVTSNMKIDAAKKLNAIFN